MRCLHATAVAGTTRADRACAGARLAALAVSLASIASSHADAASIHVEATSIHADAALIHADAASSAAQAPILPLVGSESRAGDDESVTESSVRESHAAREARMRWWREARFGMFIHWGLYSVAAGEWNGRRVGGVGEWIMLHGKIPLAEYETLLERFDPVDFDARAWVAVAQRAGMRYIVITSKHHDGFCLWPSALTQWDIAATPFGRPGPDAPKGRDPLGELYAACEAAGVRLCLYHSIMDWHHPDYLPRRAWDERPVDEADFDRYKEHLRGQLKELLERYPNVGVIWFDGEWEESWTHDDGRELDDFVRSLKPSIIVNNRVDKGRAGMSGITRGSHFRGDFGTPEQEVPASGLPEGVDWESCMTMNDTWGFKADDQNWKSPEELIRTLIDVVSKGGNFLLNVGPDGRGRIPSASVERLAAVGAWLGPRREAIDGTRASPLGALPWGRCTQRALEGGGTRLYFFVERWPSDGRLRVRGLANEVNRAFVLGDEREPSLVARQGHDGLEIDLSRVERSVPFTVVAVDLHGAPRLRPRAALLPPPEMAPDPGLRVLAIERDGIRRLADLDDGAVVERFVAPTVSIERRPRDEHFGLRFSGFIDVPAEGTYTFSLDSDDGARLRIGDEMVIDDDGLHQRRTVTGIVTLAKGWHRIRVDYFNAGGEMALRLEWSGPGLGMAESTEVPTAALRWAP